MNRVAALSVFSLLSFLAPLARAEDGVAKVGGPTLGAPTPPSPPVSAPSTELRLGAPTEEARPDPDEGQVERGVGIGFTVLGGAGIVGGGVYLAVGSASGSFRGDFGALGAILGLFPIGVGVVFSAIGIPLWVDGQSRVDRAKKANGLALAPVFSPLPGGALAGFGGAF